MYVWTNVRCTQIRLLGIPLQDRTSRACAFEFWASFDAKRFHFGKQSAQRERGKAKACHGIRSALSKCFHGPRQLAFDTMQLMLL